MNNNWINIEDKLPEDKQIVKIKVEMTSKARYNANKPRSKWSIECGWDQFEVIAWRPLDEKV